MIIKIGVKPLSVNEVWQGRRFKTKKYRLYERQVLENLALINKLGEKDMVKGEVSVILAFHLRNYKRCDLDNFVKPLLDIIVKAGLIEDDRKVMRIGMAKFPTGVGEEDWMNIVISSIYPEQGE